MNTRLERQIEEVLQANQDLEPPVQEWWTGTPKLPLHTKRPHVWHQRVIRNGRVRILGYEFRCYVPKAHPEDGPQYDWKPYTDQLEGVECAFAVYLEGSSRNATRMAAFIELWGLTDLYYDKISSDENNKVLAPDGYGSWDTWRWVGTEEVIRRLKEPVHG